MCHSGYNLSPHSLEALTAEKIISLSHSAWTTAGPHPHPHPYPHLSPSSSPSPSPARSLTLLPSGVNRRRLVTCTAGAGAACHDGPPRRRCRAGVLRPNHAYAVVTTDAVRCHEHTEDINATYVLVLCASCESISQRCTCTETACCAKHQQRWRQRCPISVAQLSLESNIKRAVMLHI